MIVPVADTLTDQPKKAYPASCPGVISVGALDEAGTLSGFSNNATPVTSPPRP
ncbi:hypothetical protein [Actinomadura sp. GC306]|uniref:hypothetical protein n=1 Tax=Actinomadura sp. GC306 TaxID=2530367 RepID=UPI001404C2F3|nr:hypothetical protein [Actinomadura sp. GC306]